MHRGFTGFLALALTVLGGWIFAKFLLPILLPFLVGLALALAAEPLTRLLHRKAGLSRSMGAAISVTLTCAALAVPLAMLGAFALKELTALGSRLPQLEQTARLGIHAAETRLLQLTRDAPEGIRGVLERNVTGIFSDGSALLDRAAGWVLGLAGKLIRHIPGSALTLGTGLISAYLFAPRLPRLRKWITGERLQRLLALLGRVKSALGGWVLAQVKLSGVTFGILLVGFLLLRISGAPVLAALICLVDAFPILGTGSVLLPWALLKLLTGDTARAVGLAGIFVTVSTVRSVLEPRLLGSSLGLDPLVTLIAMYAGFQLLGIGGLILAPVVTVTAMQLVPRENDKL